MPKVYNWQLGREMLYPYEERHPRWQFAFVFNINRCIACQTCTMACKSTWTFSRGQEAMWWNNVETKPYGGYPRHWDVQGLRLPPDAPPGAGRTPTWQVPAADGDPAPAGAIRRAWPFRQRRITPQFVECHAVGYLPADE